METTKSTLPGASGSRPASARSRLSAAWPEVLARATARLRADQSSPITRSGSPRARAQAASVSGRSPAPVPRSSTVTSPALARSRGSRWRVSACVPPNQRLVRAISARFSGVAAPYAPVGNALANEAVP